MQLKTEITPEEMEAIRNLYRGLYEDEADWLVKAVPGSPPRIEVQDRFRICVHEYTGHGQSDETVMGYSLVARLPRQQKC